MIDIKGIQYNPDVVGYFYKIDTEDTFDLCIVLINGTLLKTSYDTQSERDNAFNSIKDQIEDSQGARAFNFKGSVNSLEELEEKSATAQPGDVWQVPPDKEYAWNGTEWVELGFNIDLTPYAKITYVDQQDGVLANGISANETLIQTENKERKEADKALQESIDKEVSERQAADKVNSDAISDNVKAISLNEENLTKEIEDRKSEDVRLGKEIVKVSPFIISLSEIEGSNKYSSDKTYEEIKGAYDQGRILICKLGEAEFPLMNAEINSNGAGFTFGYTQVQFGGEYVFTRAVHYLHTETSDEWEDNDRTGYYIKLEIVKDPSSGEEYYQVASNINMGEHSIGNIQKLHIDGTAPLYIGQVIEAQDADKPRLTGVVNSNAAAFVKSDKQSEYVPVFVGLPTSNDHAATKKYVDDNKGLPSAGGSISGDLSVGGKLSVAGIASSLSAPVQGVDLCNKKYVDEKVGSIFNYNAETKTLTITTI